MSREMKVAVQTALNTVEMQKRPVPAPKAGEVLVKVRHVGICGSDLHYYEHGRIGNYIVDFPFVLGHESAGIVEEVGEGVTGLQVGDAVTLEPGITCGKCEFCKTGRYNLCPDVEFFATPPFDGTFCEYVTHPADMCFKLPSNMDTMEGALVEPLAVGLHAAAQGNAHLGQTATILGSGCIGLVTLLSLKAMGVTEIYVADVIQKRLDKALELGATAVIRADEKDTIEEINKLTGGMGTDLVFETAGSAITTKQTADLVKMGGTVVIVGLAPDPVVPYNIGGLAGKEATLKTVFRYRNLYPVAISAIASGRIPIKSIVTDIFKFDETAKAMDYSVNNKRDIVKAVIEL